LIRPRRTDRAGWPGEKARRAMNFIHINNRLTFHNGAQCNVENLIHHILWCFIKRSSAGGPAQIAKSSPRVRYAGYENR
jgi:hypothetical protein